MTKCINCGADFDESAAGCPYCGFINPTGAEKQYMDNLESLRNTLDDVDDKAREEYRQELKSHGRRILKTAFVLVALAGIVGVIVLLFSMWDGGNQDSATEELDRLLWTKEAYPLWDDMYEAGDYEGLYNAYTDSLEKGYTAYDYAHFGIIEAYGNKLEYDNIREEISRRGQADKLLVQSLTYCGFYFYYRAYADEAMMSDEDLAIADGWRQAIVTSLYGELGYSEAELENIRNDVYGAGYIDFRQVEKLSDKRYREINIR